LSSEYHEVPGSTLTDNLFRSPKRYPAGHIYAYSLLHYITEAGQHLQRAQWIFAAVYIATLALVFGIYQNSRKVSPFPSLLGGSLRQDQGMNPGLSVDALSLRFRLMR